MSPYLAVYVLWLIWVVSWVAAMPWSAQAQKRAGWKREIPSRVAVVFGAVLLFGVYAPHHLGLAPLWRLRGGWGWLATALTAAGFAFTWWARIHLGLLWSSSVTRKTDHRIVDTGPYALVRHPIYGGLILAGFATAAEIGTAVALIGAAIMTAGWYLKAKLEEKFLREELGADAYDRYAEKAPMLVPFLRL